MLLSIFASLTLSALPLLSDKTLERVIASRHEHEVIAVLFEDSRAEDRTLQTAFRNASISLEGIVKMMGIDVRRYNQLPKEYQVSGAPAIRIWADPGMAAYRGANTSKAIVKKLQSFIPDITLKADESWAKDTEASPIAIFFTDTGRVPPIWRAMAIRFQNTSTRIGVGDNSEIAEFFNAASVPAIYASNGQSSEFFKGKLNATVLFQWLSGFKASGPVKKPERSLNEIETPDKFERECVGGKTLCIVVKSAKVSGAMAQIAKDFAKLKIKWLAGVERLPYGFMQKGSGSWVYNPRRDGFAHAATDEELRNILEAVENGQGKFTKRSELDDL
jgi:hypothetical protein